MNISDFRTGFCREGRVVLVDNGTRLDRFDGLNFRFHIDKTHPDGANESVTGTVGILGLSMETIKAWSSVCSPEITERRKRYVCVFAGYSFNGGAQPIAALPVVGAIPTPPPDMWLNFTCWNGHPFTNETISMALSSQFREGLKIREICERVASEFGWKLTWNVKSQYESYLPRIQALNLTGTKWNMVEQLNRIGPVKVSLSEEMVGVFDVRYETTMRVDFNLDFFQKAAAEKVSNAPVISVKTGMIGMPQYGDIGSNSMKVKTLLRSDIDVDDIVEVKSEIIPAVNDYYKVAKVTFDGEFRGEQWYTTFDLRRMTTT